ncbi:MAG: ScyD/ScyE family protein [Actinomycetota bacterium]|nr:ScyD/ScyE family protein [Actinomycetota bacterium]
MTRKIVHVVAALALTGAVLAISAGTANAKPPPYVGVLYGLNNPRQLSFAADGSLYLAEAGKGKVGASDQSGKCVTGPEGPSCAGDTGSIIRILHPGTNPEGSRIIKHLLSLAGPDGTGATGLDSVSVQGSHIYGIVTYGDPASLPTTVANQNGKLLRFGPGRTGTAIADIGKYSLSHPLPGHDPDTDPYGVLASGADRFVADAANNTLLNVLDGKISHVATFEHRTQDPRDGVPTSIAEHNGRLYIGLLGSLDPGQGKVVVLNKSGQRVRVIAGLSSVNGVAVASNGDVYATELFTGAPFGSPGALVKIPANGGPRVVTPLPAPGGVAVGPHGGVYVSINSVNVKTGAVVRMTN